MYSKFKCASKLVWAARRLSASTASNETYKLTDRCFIPYSFFGRIETRYLFPYPNVRNESDSFKSTLKNLVALLRDVNSLKIDHDEKIPQDVIKALRQLKVLGSTVPKQYGGLGLSAVEHTKILETLGRIDLNIAMLVRCQENLVNACLARYASDAQKENYLKRFTDGAFGAFCLTEKPGTLTTLRDSGAHYVLNGKKINVLLSDVAEVFVVFAVLESKKLETGRGLLENITAVIVDNRNKSGNIKKLGSDHKMGLHGVQSGEVVFENVPVPKGNVIGKAGEGMVMAMEVLSECRCSTGAILLGAMQDCIEKASHYIENSSRLGYGFNSATVRQKLAKMMIQHYVAESMVYMIASNLDKPSTYAFMETGISKINTSEAACKICDETIQIMGNLGCLTKSGMEKMMRDLRIFKILEGSNEVHRIMVALGGLEAAGKYYRNLRGGSAVQVAETQRDNQVRQFKTKSKVISGTPCLDHSVHENLLMYGCILSNNIDNFAQSVENVLFRFGDDILKEDFILHRIADCAVSNFASIVTLSRATKALDDKTKTCSHEAIMAQSWVLNSIDEIRNSVEDVSVRRNLENLEKLKQVATYPHKFSFV